MPNIVFDLVNVVESSVRTKCLRNLDASILLIVLEKSRNHTWKCERAAVESVGKLSLSVSILISELQTVGLI